MSDEQPPSEHSTFDATQSTLAGAPTADLTSYAKIGQRIGPYKILEVLGEGGFGVVYLAEQQEPVRRRVALKIIKPGMDTKQVIARFEAERQALALMDHPNVAQVFDAGATEQGRPYFVMEHVPGVPITEHCDRHKLSIEQRLDLFMQVCEAVQHAHQKGIIHRDIKPRNILVAVRDGQAVPKVIDFGVVKALNQPLTERTIFTEQGQLIGTPEYMSPEQAEMTAQDIDTRSDIYSLGVLLYELLTGTLPFDRDSLRRAGLAEIQRIIREVEPPKPSTKLSTMITGDGDESTAAARNRRADPRTLTRLLRGDLDWITMKALEKDRTRRYATASDLAADIQRHLRHEPVIAGPPSAAYRIRKFVRRNRGLVTGLAAVFGVLLLGVTGTTWGLVQAIEAREGEAQQRELAEAKQAEAERQAKIAQVVNNFLNDDLLAAVAPEEKGRDVTVREVLDAASEKIEGRFDKEPLVEAAIRRTLGRTYLSLAEYPSAELHLEKAHKLRRAGLGDEHPDTLVSMNDLALLYHYQGRYAEAEALQVKTLEIKRRVLGEEHPDTLASMSNLAGLYKSQGRYDEAGALELKALELTRRVRGDQHPDTLFCMANLASWYEDQGRYEEAEALCVEALELRRRLLGQEHPHTLTSMNNLAGLYESLGRYDEAEALYAKTLGIRRRVLGEGHRDTLTSMNNLAFMYKRQGRYHEAEPLYVGTLNGLRRLLGEEHADTLTSMNNLAELYKSQGRYDQAEALCVKTLHVQRRVLGDEHSDALRSMNNLAQLYKRQGRYDEAESLHGKTLEIRRRVLGEEHPHTLVSMYNLASLYTNRARYDKAMPLIGAAVRAARRSLPEGHWHTGLFLAKQGACLAGLKRNDEAEAALLEAHQILDAALGAQHKRTAEVIQTLIDLYDAWDKPEQAAEWRAKLPTTQPSSSKPAGVTDVHRKGEAGK